MADPDGTGGGLNVEPDPGPGAGPGDPSPDTPERPPPGPDDGGRPTETHTRPDPADEVSPFGPPPALPRAPLPWDAGDGPAVLGDGFAIETRAEKLDLLTLGDRVHRGDEAHLRTGAVDEFVDTVAGEERGKIRGRLTERTAKASRQTAVHQETTVHGRLSVSAVGWSENALSGEDGIILGGAMTDTWTGGTLIAAAMSDDLVVGAGARITAPVDVWMNALHGMEERPGSALADGVTMDICGTLFEREYGGAVHAAGIAVFSGTVYQTQRMGFRPMMKVALGVRNLVPGSGAGASAPAPPAAAGGESAAQGAMLVTGAAAGGAGMARSADSFQDMGRVVDSAADLQNASDLSRAGDTAETVGDMSRVANTADTVDEVAHVRLPDDFDQQRLMEMLDYQITSETTRVENLRAGSEDSIGNVNRMIADKLDELAALEDTSTPANSPTTGLDLTPLPAKPGSDVSADVGRVYAEGGIPSIPWPSGAAADPDVRRTELSAEVDALVAVKMALENKEDPVAFVRQMADQAGELFGAADPRTVALEDVSYYQERVGGLISRVQGTADLYILARAEVSAGFDPRTLLRNIANGADAETSQWVRNVLASINPYLPDDVVRNVAATPDVVEDVVDVRRVGDVDVPPPGGVDPVPAGLDPPPASAPDPADLAPGPGTMDVLAPDAGDQVRQALDPPPPQASDGIGDVPPPATLEPGAPDVPVVQTRFDETGASWLDDAGDTADGVRGDYQDMAPSGAGRTAGDAEDTRAVVDGVPTRSGPEDFDWKKTYSEELLEPYMAVRRELDLRPTMAYGDAVNGLREDLYRGLTEILGTSEGIEEMRADGLYARAQELANSADAVQAQKARELLEAVDAKTYELATVLATRAEEFANAAARHPLDQHLDQGKLIDWLMARQSDAAEIIHTAPTDVERTVAGQEMAYWHQLVQAVGDGKSPVAESSEQIAYLRSIGNTEQAETYLRYHDDLLQTVSDPAFHRTAAEMGDNTYAPRAFLWPTLGPPPGGAAPLPAVDGLEGVTAYRNALLDRRAQLQEELFALARMVDGDDILAPSSLVDEPGRTSDLRDMIRNFAANVDTVDGTQDALEAINTRARDLAADLAGGAPDIADADSLRSADNALGAGGGLESSDLFRNLVSDEMMEEGYVAGIDAQGRGSFSDLTGDADELADLDLGDYAVNRDEINQRVGARDFARAPLRPPTGLRHFAVGGTKGLGARRTASPDPGAPPVPVPAPGDSIIGGSPPPGGDFGLARLTRDGNVPAAWDRPAPSGPVRTWDSGVHGASVRFGAGRNPSREEAEEGVTEGDDAADGGGETHWWTGGGRGTDPLNLDGALRPVSASGRMCADTPGFGGGASPFGARAELVADLMRGQLLKPASVDPLRGTVAEGRRAGRGRNPESANLAALLRALKSGGEQGQGGPAEGTLDWRTLEILLDMLDSSAAMC